MLASAIFTANQSVFLPMCRTYDFQGNNVVHIIKWDSADQALGPTGGARSQWVAEGGTFTPVDLKLKTDPLQAHKNGIFVDVSREAASPNAQGLVAELGSQMSRTVAYSLDDAIMNGDGLGKPLKILNNGSPVNVAQTTANLIDYCDITAMYKRLYPSFIRNAAWFCSPDGIEQLLTLEDPASQYIWTPLSQGVGNARSDYLLGLPVYLTDKCLTLGHPGRPCFG